MTHCAVRRRIVSASSSADTHSPRASSASDEASLCVVTQDLECLFKPFQVLGRDEYC
jgi:hypothetical protein